MTDRRRADGVDVRDAIEAVTACDTCRGNHCAALLDETIPRDRRLLDDPPRVPMRRTMTEATEASETTAVTDNGESTPFLPPQDWTGRDATDGSDTLNTDNTDNNDDGEDGG